MPKKRLPYSRMAWIGEASSDHFMSAKIPAPNYTQIPNVIFDAIKEMEGGELAVILIVCRLTFGWHKEKVKISLSELTKATGYTRPGVIESIKRLEARNWLIRTKSKQGFEYQIAIELVNSVDQRQETDFTSTRQVTLPALGNSVYQPEAPHIEGKERLKEIEIPAQEAGSHQAFIDSWCEAYEKHFEEKYCVIGGKDGSAVKRLLKFGIPSAELLDLAKWAWDHIDLFNCNIGTSISGFVSRLNEIRNERRQSKGVKGKPDHENIGWNKDKFFDQLKSKS